MRGKKMKEHKIIRIADKEGKMLEMPFKDFEELILQHSEITFSEEE
jgi:hypothetical protein